MFVDVTSWVKVCMSYWVKATKNILVVCVNDLLFNIHQEINLFYVKMGIEQSIY